ncbi:MAG: DUF1559 domain-containing protein [Planctomycetota bacterium]
MALIMQRRLNVGERTNAAFAGGFTVVEMLIVISLIGILLTLLLPALQQARGSARNIACRNALRQIGVACNSMQSNTGYFPTVGKRYFPTGFSFSAQVQLLPYMEQTVFFEDLDLTGPVRTKLHMELLESSRLQIWQCPNDATEDVAAALYLGNDGFEMDDSFRKVHDGFLGEFPGPGLTPADFTDGLSNTAAFSEVASFRGSKTFSDGYFGLPRENLSRNEWSEFLSECSRIRLLMPDARPISQVGDFWLNGFIGTSSYAHYLPPGSNSCFETKSGSGSLAVPTATSRHGGFVNTLLADGSIRPFSFSTDAAVWQSTGIRSDGNGDFPE